MASISSLQISSTNYEIIASSAFSAEKGKKSDGTYASFGSLAFSNASIPSVNNATVTIQKNGTTVTSFKLNDSTATTANITVPTGALANSSYANLQTQASANLTAQSARYASNADTVDGIDASTFASASQLGTIAGKSSGDYISTANGSVKFNNVSSITGTTSNTIARGDHTHNYAASNHSHTFSSYTALQDKPTSLNNINQSEYNTLTSISSLNSYLNIAKKTSQANTGLNTTDSAYTFIVGSRNSVEQGFIYGTDNTATNYSVAFGANISACGNNSYAEGISTKALGDISHVEGEESISIGYGSHAEGYSALASGYYSHAEGAQTIANGWCSHAEGIRTVSQGKASHAQGEGASALGEGSFAGGFDNDENGYILASGNGAVAIGASYNKSSEQVIASGNGAIALGIGVSSYGPKHGGSVALGRETLASGAGALSNGFGTSAIGIASYAEGASALASGNYSHAEGIDTIAMGEGTHAEGCTTLADLYYSHAEGQETSAIGIGSHAEGMTTQASGPASHAEGNNTIAMGSYSHAGGYSTIANYSNQTVIGKYNNNRSDTFFEIGNGTEINSRTNAFIVTTAGVASATTLKGVTVSSTTGYALTASGNSAKFTNISATNITGTLKGSANFALSATDIKWSNGTDNIARPIGFAWGDTDLWGDGTSTFYKQIVYDKDFTYNPSSDLLNVKNLSVNSSFSHTASNSNQFNLYTSKDVAAAIRFHPSGYTDKCGSLIFTKNFVCNLTWYDGTNTVYPFEFTSAGQFTCNKIKIKNAEFAPLEIYRTSEDRGAGMKLYPNNQTTSSVFLYCANDFSFRYEAYLNGNGTDILKVTTAGKLILTPAKTTNSKSLVLGSVPSTLEADTYYIV